MLPLDHLCAETFGADAKPLAVDGIDIPDNLMGMDVGPKTLALYKDIILKSKSIVWNGPVGVFEFENFAKGTGEVARLVAEATSKRFPALPSWKQNKAPSFDCRMKCRRTDRLLSRRRFFYATKADKIIAYGYVRLIDTPAHCVYTV